MNTDDRLLKEVIILNDFASQNGGASVVAVRGALELARQGVRVTFFSAVAPTDPSLVGVPGLEVVCLGQEEIVNDPNRLRALVRGAWNGPAAHAFGELLRTRDPARTVVHAHLWMKALSPAVFAPAFAAKIPVVVTLHDFFAACPNGGFYVYPTQEICHRRPLSASCVACRCDRRSYPQKLWRVGRTVLQKYRARLPAKVAHFVGVSAFATDILRPHLPAATPATVVRNPIDCPDLGPADVAANAPFVFVGRLVPEKGPRLFAEAARLAGVPAVFVGDGELRAELERDFPEATITGWRTPQGVTEMLRGARALVFPSRWYETLGLVAVEAAANGVPTVVSDGCAARETVADGVRGLHFQAGSAESLAEKLRRLAADPGLAGQYGRAAYDWYWADPWTSARHIEDLLGVYRQVLEIRSGRLPATVYANSAPPETTPARPRTVLLVSEPGVDGVFHYVRDLATYLHGLGWPVHVAYSSVRDCAALHDFVGAVKSWGGRTLDLRVGNFPGPADVPALWRLRALAKETRPEVIHGHSSKAGVLVRTLPMLGVRAQFFYTPHAYYQMHGPASAKKRVFGLIERAFGGVGTTICTSPSESNYARDVVGIAAGRSCPATSGVDCERYRPPATPDEKNEARARFGLPTGVPLLGTVARQSAQKDPLTLYRAMLDAMARRPGFCFAHVGKGELSGEVDALLAAAPEAVRSRIYRIPASTDAPTFYRALDGFTLPSRYEGFALSALEALATGLPLVLTRCPGNDDLGHYGFDALRWSEVGDAGALSAQILGWLDGVADANNHRATVVEKLNGKDAWQRVVRCYTTPPDAELPCRQE